MSRIPGADHAALVATLAVLDAKIGRVQGSISGVEIKGVMVDVDGGSVCVPFSELQEILTDADLWQAKLCGTTKERYLAYVDWQQSGGGCRGTTSEGKPCRWPHDLPSRGEGPAQFVLGVSDRCRYHGGGDPYEKAADA